MRSRYTRLGGALAIATSLTLLACGGGTNRETAAPTTSAPTTTPVDSTPTPVTQDVSVRVIDGPLANAVVFLDKNRNGLLDGGEPNGKTDSAGRVTLKIEIADIGTAPLVALVGTDAVDADTSAVPVAYALSTPADRTSVISPLTTIVQRIVADGGVTTEQAAQAAQSQAGLSVSLFTDFTVDSTSEGKAAATLARLMVVATQKQLAALGGVLGQKDFTGAAITSADLIKVVQQDILKSLSEIAAAARDASILDPCAIGYGSPNCVEAMQVKSTEIVAASTLTAVSAPTTVGFSRPSTTSSQDAPASATASLSFLNFGESDAWYYRVFVSSAAENTPDSSGFTRYRSISRSYLTGRLLEWGTGGSYIRRDDSHWNGTAWVGCPFGLAMKQTPRDANGAISYSDYCDGLQTSSSSRLSVDISGKKMADIVLAIRSSLPAYAGWGDPPFNLGYSGTGTANYGSAVFPAGSLLYSQTNVVTATAPAYDVTSPVMRYSSAITAGGDTRKSSSTSCQSVEASNSPSVASTTLEDMIANFKGTPCIYRQSSLSSSASPTPLLSPDPDEWWGNSTLNIGVIGTEDYDSLYTSPTSWSTGNKLVRVGFVSGAGNKVIYYSCLQRVYTGSPRNCTSIGNGTYTISQLGDARVMSFSSAPALSASLDYERIFVERGGQVYFGIKSKIAVSKSTRLNLAATNALFKQIGIPAIVP